MLPSRQHRPRNTMKKVKWILRFLIFIPTVYIVGKDAAVKSLIIFIIIIVKTAVWKKKQVKRK